MWPCPRLASDISHEKFWATMSDKAVPRIIPGLEAVDFVEEFGRKLHTGGAAFEFAQIEPAGKRYMLSNPGTGPNQQSSTFAALPLRFPLPLPLRSIDLTPMVSIGLNGTGQTDLARHYHGVTAMRLLQGIKIWALRPPFDAECMANTGSCTDPFDVCAFYSRPGSAAPACVQHAGDTIIIPDGWHHGTCNAADEWTVGWGGQNRRLRLDPPPRCHHCRPSGPRHFTTAGSEEAVSRNLATQIVDMLEVEVSERRRREQLSGGRKAASGSGSSSGRGGISSSGRASRSGSSGIGSAADVPRTAESMLLAVSLRGSSVPLVFRGLFMQCAT